MLEWAELVHLDIWWPQCCSHNLTTLPKSKHCPSPQPNLLNRFAQRLPIRSCSWHNLQAMSLPLCNMAAVAGSGEEELSWVRANLLLQALC